jgi:hypothetical protein
MRTTFFYFLFFFFYVLQAQEEIPKSYSKSSALGIHFYTYGWGFDFHQSYRINDKREHILKIDIASLKNKNESRNASVYRDQGGKAYIYGKTHYGYNLGLTYGQQWYLIPKRNINHVSFILGINGGAAFAILKPYYVEVINAQLSRIDIDQYSSAKYTINDIVGESDFFQGFDKLKLIPGFRLKFHTFLDLGNENYFVRALYSGIQTDIFAKKPEIMDTVQNPQIFFSLFMGFLIGNKY